MAVFSQEIRVFDKKVLKAGFERVELITEPEVTLYMRYIRLGKSK